MANNKPLLLILLFISAIIFHLIGLNKIGRTWDEQFKVDMGFIAWDRIFAEDFSLSAWKHGEEHPMVAKYIYGIFIRPHMIRLDDGNGKQANLSDFDISQLQNDNYIITGLYDKIYSVSYDFTFPRMASSIFNALAIVLTAIIGGFVLSGIWIALPGIFLLLAPRFLVMGQLATYESISVFLFCLTVLAFHRLLNHSQGLKNYFIVGILSGLLFWTRYNNVFVFFFILGWLIIHYIYKKQRLILQWKLLFIPLIAILIGIAIWPLMWQEFPKYLIETFKQHESRNIGPSLYFIQYLAVTTPIPILLGLILGLFSTFKKGGYWQAFFLWWFFSTLIFFSLFSVPSGGTRYIIVIYPALAILAAYGYKNLLSNKALNSTKTRIFVLGFIFLTLVWEVHTSYPYYLDYYNQLVGGPKGAAQKNYDFSWWGEGQREVGFWINKNIPSGSSVGLIVTPKYVFPALKQDLKNNGYVDPKNDADYIVLSRYDEIKIPTDFFRNHSSVYSANIAGVPLVSVYKKK